MVASRMRAALDRGDDSAAVLSRFVGTLTADEERALVALLAGREQDAG